MDAQQASDIYTELQVISWQILDATGIEREPHKPNVRTKKWGAVGADGIHRPKGIIYHYTNGPSGLKSMKWGNKASWGNTGSSWHFMIFDRITDNKVGELWDKLVSSDLRRLFPVPTIVTADWRWGTWHGNWTNDTTIGIENRNTGYSGWMRLGKDGIKQLGKEPSKLCGRSWEPYTRQQVVCNINIGRVAHAFWDDGNGVEFDPDWVLPHQAIWATKSDTGPFFPIHDVREEVFTKGDLHQLDWLNEFKMAPDTNEDDDTYWEILDTAPRVELEAPFEVEPAIDIKEVDHAWTAAMLYKMGFNTGPELPMSNVLRESVKKFQKSTMAYKYHEKFPSKWMLTVDGVCGPVTRKAISRRVYDQLRLESKP